MSTKQIVVVIWVILVYAIVVRKHIPISFAQTIIVYMAYVADLCVMYINDVAGCIIHVHDLFRR